MSLEFRDLEEDLEAMEEGPGHKEETHHPEFLGGGGGRVTQGV